MAEEKLERDRLADTVTAKLENLVKYWWFQRVYHSWFGEEEENFTSEMENLLVQVKQEKAEVLRDNNADIVRIASQTSSTRKQAAVMTKVKAYLEGNATWKDVELVRTENVGYNAKSNSRTEEIVLKASAIDRNPTALAIQVKLTAQIRAYLRRYEGVDNAKTKVMTVLDEYLNDRATWTAV